MITVNSTLSYERQTVPPIIPAVQGDTGRSISFKIADTTIPEGATATFYIQKPSGNAIYNTAEVISSNQILVPLDAQCLAEVGENFGQVRILLNGDVVTSFDFILLVKVFHGIDAIESTTEMNIFDQAVEEAMEEIGAILDPTLTLANKAAEAKAVGDALQWDVSKYNRPRISRGTGQDSTKENLFTQANGMASHAQGISTQANGIASYSGGSGTIAGSDYQHVFGKYNVEDANNTYVEIVGNGVAPEGRNNARTLDWNGNEVLWGDLTIFHGLPNETKLSDLKQDLRELDVYTLGLYPQMEVADTAVASFTDGADNIPVKSLTVDITPVQSGTGDPSPENIRPISGWTGANVSVFDVNAWDEEWELGGVDGTTGQNITGNDRIRSKNYIPIIPGASYYWGYFGSKEMSFYVCEYDANKNFIQRTQKTKNAVYSFDCAYVRFFVYATGGMTTYSNDISINYPSTDHDYHAYKGGVYSVDWTTEAGTVYGGTLDVTNGVLTVDRAYATITSFQGKSGATTNNLFYVASYASTIKKPSADSGICEGFISDKFMTRRFTGTDSLQPNSVTGIAVNTGGSIYVGFSLDGISTLADANTWASANPIQIVYPLATPQVIQLSQTEVTTLLRNNNIFADTGNVNSLTYRADLKAYIDEKLA